MRKKNMFRTMLTVISTWVVIFMLIGCANENDEGIARNEENVVGNDEPSSSANEFNLDLMTIVGHEQSDSVDGDNHLSLEEAALAGVEYILSFFEFDFEGTYMELHHIINTENFIFNRYNTPVWRGDVYRTEQFNLDNRAFFFVINAMNGEWLVISRTPDPIRDYSLRELAEKTMEELRELFPPPEKDEINRTLEVAKVYAQRHFRNSTLYRIDPLPVAISPAGIGFKAEDEHGQIIHVGIQRETYNLVDIEVQSSIP